MWQQQQQQQQQQRSTHILNPASICLCRRPN
jgi:hypothetical protein